MGKTYYCDYCDRSFKDNVEARKKHLASLQHTKNRTDHYNAFKDPETILKEEYGKTPCKRYMTVGECAFGLGCRFSHYTPSMMWELEQLVAMKNTEELVVQPTNGWPNPQDIIEEYLENEMDSSSEKLERSVWIGVPSSSADYSYLPQSLRPVTSAEIVDCDLNKWN
ncbi:hypothetical protein HN011_003977 [Eciton burchellii]|nr:hypothetical protein HN011_003977 [Eciton burchellii]